MDQCEADKRLEETTNLLGNAVQAYNHALDALRSCSLIRTVVGDYDWGKIPAETAVARIKSILRTESAAD
jgi:hypothetical protein